MSRRTNQGWRADIRGGLTIARGPGHRWERPRLAIPACSRTIRLSGHAVRGRERVRISRWNSTASSALIARSRAMPGPTGSTAQIRETTMLVIRKPEELRPGQTDRFEKWGLFPGGEVRKVLVPEHVRHHANEESFHTVRGCGCRSIDTEVLRDVAQLAFSLLRLY